MYYMLYDYVNNFMIRKRWMRNLDIVFVDSIKVIEKSKTILLKFLTSSDNVKIILSLIIYISDIYSLKFHNRSLI